MDNLCEIDFVQYILLLRFLHSSIYILLVYFTDRELFLSHQLYQGIRLSNRTDIVVNYEVQQVEQCYSEKFKVRMHHREQNKLPDIDV